MIYRTTEEIIETAMKNSKERMREVAEKNMKKIKYNEKIKKRGKNK